MGAESFTVLTILEARNRAAEAFGSFNEGLNKVSETSVRTAEAVKGAGEAIDEALGRDVPVSDRLETATARLSAAQLRAADAARALTDAEKGLRDAQAAAAGAEDGDTAATARLLEADKALSAAQKDAATAATGLRDAQAAQATASKAAADAADGNAAAQDRVTAASDGSGLSLGKVGRFAGIAALGMTIAGGLMVKAAGNFQDATTHLVTDAGETQLAKVQAGILAVSTATATSATDITNAMYHIDSAGYTVARGGLTVLKIAAEGAKVGGADLDTVSKTLVGTLNAYGQGAGSAASFMNQLISTVSVGDMRMQDLASSLSAVAPLAAASGISFAQVGGAIATMTAQGMSARQSTQDLANTIRSLSNPNHVAITEMGQLGLSSQDVSKNLGKRGLDGTIQMLTSTILSHMGKSGEVLMSAFNQSKAAAQDANVMIQAMPASLQGLARQFLAGSISSKQWSKDLQGLSPIQAHLMTQFATTADKAHGFNSLLTSGSPAAQTYTAALAKMMGGATGLNTALMLSGGRMSVFEGNVAAITAAAKKAGSSVDNWSTIQSTFNFKLASAKTAVENTGIAIGTALLPAATALLSAIVHVIEPIAQWTAHNKTLTEILFAGVTAIAATIAVISLAAKAYKAITETLGTVKKALQLVGLIAKESAGDQEAAATEAAATQETAAAEAAAAQEEAAAESSSSWLLSFAKTAAGAAAQAAKTLASWAVAGAGMIAQGAIWVATNTAKVAIVVAENVAGALVTAAAWIVANAAMLLGIGLIVIAVVAAVALIVTHWKQISEFAKKVFDDVLHIVESVINWVKGHWPLLLAILVGPIGIAVLLIVKYWRQIMNGISDVINWVKGHWPLILAILTGPIGIAVLLIVKYWTQIKDGASRMISDLVSFFTRLPGQILHALGDLGHLLWSAGASILKGLISGIESQFSSLVSTASNIAGTIKSFLPFSPAKRGPLAGSGSPENSGQSIAKNMAKGMLSGAGYVTAAAHHLAGSVALGGTTGSPLGAGIGPGGYGGAGGSGGGDVNITIDLRGATVMSDRDIDLLVNKLGPPLARALGQAGVKVRFG